MKKFSIILVVLIAVCTSAFAVNYKAGAEIGYIQLADDYFDKPILFGITGEIQLNDKWSVGATISPLKVEGYDDDYYLPVTRLTAGYRFASVQGFNFDAEASFYIMSMEEESFIAGLISQFVVYGSYFTGVDIKASYDINNFSVFAKAGIILMQLQEDGSPFVASIGGTYNF